MRLTTNKDIRDTSVWNEVKNWDVEDKRTLITLLFSSIEEYDDSDNCDMDAYAKEISWDLLLQAGEYALAESRAGRCISHVQAMQQIKNRMGWK